MQVQVRGDPCDRGLLPGDAGVRDADPGQDPPHRPHLRRQHEAGAGVPGKEGKKDGWKTGEVWAVDDRVANLSPVYKKNQQIKRLTTFVLIKWSRTLENRLTIEMHIVNACQTTNSPTHPVLSRAPLTPPGHHPRGPEHRRRLRFLRLHRRRQHLHHLQHPALPGNNALHPCA